MLLINTLNEGRAEALMQQIEPESISCSIWSPPYHLGKEYEKGQTFDEWQEMLREVIRLHTPILKAGGFMIINIADILCFEDESLPRIQHANPSMHKVALDKDAILGFLNENPGVNRYQIADHFGCSEQTIDRRLNGNNIRGGKYVTQTRVELVGSYLQQYATEAGLYLYDRRIWKKDPSWHNSKWASNSYRAVDEFEYIYIFMKPGEVNINREKLSRREWTEWGSRAVWDFPSVRANREHEAMFPLELPVRCIKLFSEIGDTILDPFMGSGTTALAAIKLSRRYIGIEKEAQYTEMARRRIGVEEDQLVIPTFVYG